jgi:hypothetical protein
MGSGVEMMRKISLKRAGMTTFVIPAIYSLAVWQSLSDDFRPMTLRRRVFPVLLFGQPVDPYLDLRF